MIRTILFNKKTYLFLFLLSTYISEIYPKTANDSLVIAFESKPQGSDPRILGSDSNAQYIEELRFLPLISFDEKGALKYVVAETINCKEKNSCKIKIKNGIKFANGKTLTADDIIATYQSILEPKADFPPSPRKGVFENIQSIKKISFDMLEIHLKSLDAPFLSNLSIGILPKEAVENAKPGEINNKGYESGPYILQSSNDAEWILVRNPHYTFSTPAKINKIIFKIISDAGTRYAALLKGDLDIAQN
ncbi:MAG: hypothetical protein K2X39_00935, partial [Silvanigrellaceae bacterium]|nr:hypothetical protein [Silvanigrellaceae bacterium]